MSELSKNDYCNLDCKSCDRGSGDITALETRVGNIEHSLSLINTDIQNIEESIENIRLPALNLYGQSAINLTEFKRQIKEYIQSYNFESGYSYIFPLQCEKSCIERITGVTIPENTLYFIGYVVAKSDGSIKSINLISTTDTDTDTTYQAYFSTYTDLKNIGDVKVKKI